jgi:uncharacterized protein (TIGR00251 family)
LIKINPTGDGVSFAVKVHPRARRERISGVLGEALKLEITEPAIEGRANQACIRFFAEFLKVPRSSVTIAAGNSNRNKVIRIAGVSVERIELALAHQKR